MWYSSISSTIENTLFIREYKFFLVETYFSLVYNLKKKNLIFKVNCYEQFFLLLLDDRSRRGEEKMVNKYRNIFWIPDISSLQPTVEWHPNFSWMVRIYHHCNYSYIFFLIHIIYFFNHIYFDLHQPLIHYMRTPMCAGADGCIKFQCNKILFHQWKPYSFGN